MSLSAFLSAHDAVALVRVARVEGSAPREEGAEMFVAPGAAHGTIGGGQLEYVALDEARGLIARGGSRVEMTVPLGPDIGQCCGGRVVLELTALDEAARKAALAAETARRAALPRVLIFGAGHTGRALAAALLPLPLRAALIDGRAEELASAAPGVETRLTALPEAEVRAAPPRTAYVVMTHDHALDFLIAGEALGRGDAAYVGMIGSASKRAAFEGWLRREGREGADRLTCPIGAAGRGDKRPEVIAAHVAGEILGAMFSTRNAQAPATGPAEGRTAPDLPPEGAR